jgi:Outer membrane protein beta-barrel domain
MNSAWRQPSCSIWRARGCSAWQAKSDDARALRRDRIAPMSRLAVFAALLLVMTSSPARADGFLTPYIGYDFSGNAASCAGLVDCTPKRTNYGVSVAVTGKSLGFEEDLGYGNDFFGEAPGTSSSVLSAMSNVLFVGGPGRIQSYLLSGLGLIRSSVSFNQSSAESVAIGYDLGGGASAFFTKHVGLRVDVRHFETFESVNVLLSSGKLGFWRASLGLALKF